MLIRATVLSGYRSLVTHLGGDPATLLKAFHMDQTNAESVTAFVPYATVVRLFEQTATELRCPTLGLQLTGYQSLDKLGPLALLAVRSRSVREAAVTVTSHLHTYSPAILMDLVRHDEHTSTLHYNLTFQAGRAPARPQMTEFSLAFAVNGFRLFAGLEFKPRAVLFRHHSSANPRDYIPAFGVRARFGQEVNALIIDNHWLDRPLDLADEHLKDAIEAYLAPLIGQDALDVHTQVEHLIARLLPTGQCNLARIATQLSMHPRTIQRQLERSGHSFHLLVEDCRKTRASELLADRRIPLAQVAALIGYQEQSTLTHACRRWFGRSPLQIRRSLATDGNATHG
ncbi:AraC family transcriptional regulator [Algiphilus sp.]|uniref:AraC family transcriptional regulator n=1 Tax=Algiphilus sp. TaxID=1872431 RepID=UPI0025B82AC3|nr:AraC family transcriptional regulator [Algiphilus sp.]MCK5771888.1 AraC family transcriptional regulator [Algiphilus sp.]